MLTPNKDVSVAFHPRIDKSLFDHLDMRALIDANFFAASADDFVTNSPIFVFAFNATLVATQHFTFAKFFILPEFALAGRTFDRQHRGEPDSSAKMPSTGLCNIAPAAIQCSQLFHTIF